jgi:hypothetical protein
MVQRRVKIGFGHFNWVCLNSALNSNACMSFNTVYFSAFETA